MPKVTCYKCGKSNARKAKFCMNCGVGFQQALHYEPPQKTFIHELFHLLFHINKTILLTFYRLLTKPGATLHKLVSQDNRYKNSILYFCTAVGIHHLLSVYVFNKLHFKHQLSGQLGDHVASIAILISLLLVMAIIGYYTLGKQLFVLGSKIDFSFNDVLVICFYLYGTNFFLAPIVITLTQPFDNYITSITTSIEEANKLTDTPLALYMLYALYRLLVHTPNYQHKYIRYAAFFLLSLTYYNLTYPYIWELKEALKNNH